MQIDTIRTIYDYHYWATRRIMNTCQTISAEQLTTAAAQGYGSLHTILVHMLDADTSWRMRCEDGSDSAEITTADVPTLDLLIERWVAEEQAMRAYLGRLSNADLAGVVRYPIGNGQWRERVRWHCLYHVVNHGTQHLSEAAALLTGYGSSPGDIDFTVFLNGV